jgi:hypothetical protein
MNTKICIGLLSNRGFEQQMVLSLMKMIHASKGLELHFEVATEGYTIAENRNTLAAKACQNKCTHLLMIDDDMIFPEETLLRLLAHDKDMVAINYHPRQFGDGYMIWKKGDKEKARTPESSLPFSLFECEGVGFGTVLIKTELFYKVERPWFDWEVYETGMVKTGEDFYFCRKAIEAGFSIWCDPTIKPTGHIGKFTF